MTIKSRKIIYITTKSVWGGAGKYTYDLATSLPQNFEVFILAGGQNLMAQKIKDANIPYFEIKGFQRDVNLFKDIYTFFEILFLLFKIKPDIIHVSSAKAGGLAGVAILLYRALQKFGRAPEDSPKNDRPLGADRISALFTVHGWTFNESRPSWQIFLIKLFSKITCLFYDKIICVSEFDKQMAIKEKIVNPKKLVAIHNGVKASDYPFFNREESRESFGLANDDFVVGTIGEYTSNKGQEFLLEAISKIKDDRVKVLLIGWGELKEKLKNKAEGLKIEKRVVFAENIFDAFRYLKAFDIFVLPSIKEGLPYVLLEAGLAKIPVIATNVGGIPEIIGSKEGFLIEPKNSNELEKNISILVKDQNLRETLGQSLNKKIENDFSFAQMLEQTLTLYENKSTGSN